MALPLAAAGLCALRYSIQGDSNVWSKMDLHLYVPDPDLGFRQLSKGVIWLGLDSILLCLVWALLVGVGHFMCRKSSAFRKVLWAAAALPLAIPALAFTQGGPPPEARSSLPTTDLGEAPRSGGTADLLTLAQGEFVVLPHKQNAVTASLEAGGERFDTRWSDVRGQLSLVEPIAAKVSVQAAQVDSQLGERDKHIRGYLKTESFPEIQVELIRLVGLTREANSARFVAKGQLALMGQGHTVDLQGSVQALSPEAKERLGVPNTLVLLLQAQFPLDLATTAIENPADNFDSLQATIHVTLLLHKP